MLNRFAHFDDFKEDCRRGTLPWYTFIEPSFVENPNDEHPTHDVVAGEQFLYDIWIAVSSSPKWNQTLSLTTAVNTEANLSLNVPILLFTLGATMLAGMLAGCATACTPRASIPERR